MRALLRMSLWLLAACASDPSVRIDNDVPDAKWIQQEDREFCAFEKRGGRCDPMRCPGDCPDQWSAMGSSAASRTTQEPGYVGSDGQWHECDPIAETERLYVGKPGWKNACSSAERMRGLRAEPPLEDDEF